MLARLSTLQARLLPHGPLDVVRQVLLFMAAYQLYRLTRGLVNHPEAATAAFQNARDLIGIERSLNLFVEPSVQAFTSGQQWLLDAASWMYINAQTSVTVGALAWLYLFRNESFYFVRNMFLVAFGDRADRLQHVPDRAAALLPRVRLLRRGLGLHRRAAGQRHDQQPLQPVRGRAVDARRVRAHDRDPARAARHAGAR